MIISVKVRFEPDLKAQVCSYADCTNSVHLDEIAVCGPSEYSLDVLNFVPNFFPWHAGLPLAPIPVHWCAFLS